MDKSLSKLWVAAFAYGAPRGLTLGEQVFVRSEFEERVDFSQVRLVRATKLPFGGEGMVLGDDIFLHDTHYLGDFSGGDPQERAVLLRQVAGVELSQQGSNMVLRELKGLLRNKFGRAEIGSDTQVATMRVGVDAQETIPVQDLNPRRG